MKDFTSLLAESVQVHGHICAGQVIGVRMSILALQRIGIDDPRGADRKKLYVLVEIDRCATDAIQSVTGCSLGKRSMYFHDFGIMAATFVNLETGQGGTGHRPGRGPGGGRPVLPRHREQIQQTA